MKYITIDERRDGRGDSFTEEFDSKEKAIELAQDWLAHMVSRERKARQVYVLESINPDPEAEDHYDGNPVWTPLYTADKATGTFIDEVKSIEDGKQRIAEYEASDKECETYEPDFYDIVNEFHESVL